MTTPNRDEALDAAAEKYAESHDPHCKWLHCPARLDAIKFFTAGAEWVRQSGADKVTKYMAEAEAFQARYSGALARIANLEAFASDVKGYLEEVAECRGDEDCDHCVLVQALAALDAQEEKR